MYKTKKRFLSLVTAVSMLLTYPTVPLASYGGAEQGLRTEQEVMKVDLDDNSGGVLLDEQDVSPASGSAATINKMPSSVRQGTTHIATYVDQIPKVDGVTWGSDVTEGKFQTPFETVTISDTNGTSYTVEVVPENLVYFIDSYNFENGTSSAPYNAVKELVGDTLRNEVYDQKKTDDNTWGLVGEAKDKSASSDTDKDMTGLYGTKNEKGNTISYAFLLSAGKYTITTAHREWWSNQDRAMELSLTTSSGTNKYASLPKQSVDQVQKKSYTFEIMTEQVVTFTATATGTNKPQAPAISWLAVVQDEDYSNITAPERPTLPSGYDQPLEDHDGLELAEGAVSSLMTGYDTMIDINVQWNNQNQYYASVKDAASLFQKNQFTVLLDIKQEAPSGDADRVDQRVALTIGNASNSLHLLTWSGKFGYGGQSSGVSTHLVNMAEVVQGGWNSLAMTYEEKNGGNGSVVVYANGKKSAEVADIGFKLSEMGDLSAMIARTFGTNYLQEGRYDNLVVFDSVVDEATLCAETAWRKWDKENPPLVNTAFLEKAVKQAEALIASQITSDGLVRALNTAKELLARTDLTVEDQKAIDEATEKLNQEYEKLNPTDILIKGTDVDAANLKKNGLTYKGFGMLNGNSTSNLLLDYKAENPTEYWEMMEYLFGGEYPLFTHIKMEMGNDGNNSTGAEACTKRYREEEADASRSPGFVMAADAKKINPNVKISILRWELPKWVEEAGFNSNEQAGWDAFYLWYKETIFDAYEKYGYVVDFINPDKNETGNPNQAFIKWFAKQIEEEADFPSYMGKDAQDAYHKIRIIASDENKGLEIVPYMRADAELYDAVDIIGFHYRTSATDDYVTMADVDNKEVWYSEGCATFGYSELQETKRTEYGYENIGGYQSPLALMDSFITAFCASRRTHYIFQPAIGSFYEGIQYGHKELLSARDPWSGYIHYDPALHMLEHFAKFAKLGWENETNTDGIWMAISQASKGSFAGSENEHATAGIDGNAGYLTLAAPDKSNFSVVFVNNTKNQKTFRIKTEDMQVKADTVLHVWSTVSSTDYLENTSNLMAVDGGWILTLPAYSVVTATTLEVTLNDAPAEGIHNEDRAVLDTDATGRNLDTTDEILYADNFDYIEESPMEQYHVNKGTTTVAYLEARGNEPRYLLDTHGAWIVEEGRLKQELGKSIAQWNGGEPATIVGDFRWMDYTAEVKVQIPNAESGVWTGLGIRTQTGMNWNQSGYTLRIDGAGNWELYRVGSRVESGSVEASADGSYTIALTGLGDTVMAVIDGEMVATYQDANPMLSGRVKFSSTWNQVYFDDFVVKKVAGGIPYALSMIDGQDKSVIYTGDWKIENPGGGSADNWYRTVSEGTAGASFEFTIEGDGFAIIGENDSSVTLTIEVDGQEKEANVAVAATPKRYETYSMSGLGMGSHTIHVTVESGTLKIDALYALGEREAADENAIVEVLTKLPELKTIFAEKGVEDLPESVEVRTAGGVTKTLPVVWENDTDKLSEYLFKETVITGTLEGGVNAAGYPVKVSVPVEVIPSGTVYFIDTVTGFSGKDVSIPSTTEPYNRISALLGNQLLNSVYDQLKEEGNTWGLVDRDAGTRGYSSTIDKTDTGIYGANNKSGETLSYAFTLPAGAYTLYSEHREWWSQNRPMSTSVRVDGKTLDAGAIILSGSSGDQLHTYDFVVEKEQVVTYTITATGSQAPVISWLAISKQDPKELREQLQALIEETKQKLADAEADGVQYAKEPLVAGQYTGAGAAPKDNLQDLNQAMADGEGLVSGNSMDAIALQTSISEIKKIFDSLRVLTEYTNIPGTVASVIHADTGLAMQAHGGSATVMKEGNGEGCVAFDLDGDGEITEGKTVYLWYGENKTNNTRPVDGVRCYVSTDLYNWVDRGNVLYLQNTILPIEESQNKAVTSDRGASGIGTTESYYAMQLSQTNFEQLKAWGRLEYAPEGISEEAFGNVKLFLRAYVTEFDKEPVGLFDTSWTAKTYDETVITASSFLYPDSQTQGTVQTTPLQLAFEGMYGGYCITERPKMVYNELTKKFIIVFHADGPLYNSKDLNSWVAGGLEGNCTASRYSRAMVGFAESETPFGPFKVVNITRMNYDTSLNAKRLGEARDMTIFVDQGVDSNQDGADDAYVVYSSEMNEKLYVSLLNKEYTAPIKEGDQAEQGTEAAYRIVADNSREAPAIMKYDGWYYLLTSGTDGWNSTEHIYYRSQSMFSGWEKVGNPAYQDTGKCFNTQVTYILPVDAESGKFIYMGDRWNSSNLSDSRTIWLPMQVGGDHTIRILGEKNWTVDRLDALTPIRIETELPEFVYTDGSNLPKVVKITRNNETMDSAVVWNLDNLILGEGAAVTGTLTDCEDAVIEFHAFVTPRYLVYLANPSADPMSEDYTKIVEWNKDTLKGSGDGEYSEEIGFGYTGVAGSVRSNNADLYQSMRYAAGGNTITYQFKISEGNETGQRYKVYVGMFDPSSWYGDHKGTRYADILINGQTVKEKYTYLNNTNDTLCFRDITPDETGMLTVTVAKNTQSKKDIQVSFLMVEIQKADKTALEQAILNAKKLNPENYTEASYQAMKEVLEAAEQVLLNEDASQEEVDAIKQQLDEAVEALEKIADKADKTALEQVVAEAEKLEKDTYTEESYQAVIEALNAAKRILADENAEQATVDKAKEALEQAIKGLQRKPGQVDKTALEQVIAEAEKLEKDNYTEESYQAVIEALNAAKLVLKDTNAAQATVDKAKEALEQAIKGLQRKPDQVDKTALEQIIAEAEKLEKDNYTEESYQAVVEALNTAKLVLADVNAEQATVDKAKEALEQAIKDLQRKPGQVDKTALEQVIAEAEKLKKDNYTEESYQAVMEALNTAKLVLADKNVEQATVDKAEKNLSQAIKALKEKPVSPDRPNRPEPDDDDDSDDSDDDDSYFENQPSSVEKPTESVSGVSNATAVVNSNGNATVTMSTENLNQAIQAAKNNASQKGVHVGDISVVVHVTTGTNQNVNTVSVNLPRTVQNQVVENKISNITVVVDKPDIAIGLNLAAVTEIRRQANGDANLVATRLDNATMTEEAKTAIGDRPVFDIKVTYSNDTKNITQFASGNVSVAIPYMMKQGERAGGIYAVYVDAQGKVSYILGSSYDPNTRMMRFVTNHFSVYGIGYQTPVTYRDLGNHWAKDDLEFALIRGLLLETGEHTASPNAAITRGALLTALGNLSAIHLEDYTKMPFTDVSAERSDAPYIAWAYEKGILNNIQVANQKFAPDQAVTRQEMAILFANYAKVAGFALPTVREKVLFVDNSAISDSAKQAVELLQVAGVVNGKSQNRFVPSETVSRAEFASTLRRYMELSIDTATAQGWTRNASGQWMYYKEGKKLIGWQVIGNVRYFFNPDGVMHEGWKQDGQTQNWYYWTNKGIASGWQEIGGKWYYFGSGNVMYKDGWKEIEGKKYYFYKDGAMAANTKIEQIEVDENGVAKE